MQDVLVYANSLRSWDRAVAYGMRLAAMLDGSVTGVHVCLPPPLMASPYAYAGEPTLPPLPLEDLRELERAAHDLRPAFVARARQQGARHAAWMVAEGQVPDVLAYAGLWHDLLVLERHPDAPWCQPGDLARLVLGTELPCLIVPDSGEPRPAFDCVALAGNGSAEALRAIHAALPLLRLAGRVLLLAGRPRAGLGATPWRPLFDLDTYLSWHGIVPERQELDTDDAHAGEALLEAASRSGAGLLVMGAFGRSRFSEWVLGGAARHVLRHSALPLFMRH